MLDRGVGVVAEPVGVDDLLEQLGIQLLGRLAVLLDLRVDADPHRLPAPPRVWPGDVAARGPHRNEYAMMSRSGEHCHVLVIAAPAVREGKLCWRGEPNGCMRGPRNAG